MISILNEAKIAEFYNDNIWTKGMVWDAVSKNKITEDEYTEITGDAYPSTRPAV